MNIAQLHTFITVVESGSFSAAAKKLGLSQPAVTLQLQALETDIGASLLMRKYRRIELTEAGEILIPYAREMLQLSDKARTEINAHKNVVAGNLTIAASTTPGDYIIPRLLAQFCETYPDVTVNLDVANTDAAVEMLQSGQADIAVVGARNSSAKVDYFSIGDDQLVLIAPSESDLSSTPNLSLSSCRSHKWIVRVHDSGTQQVVNEILRTNYIDPLSLPVVMKLGTAEAIVNAVEGGLGIAAVSTWVAARALALGTIVSLEVDEFPIHRPFYLVTPHRALSYTAQAFKLFIQQNEHYFRRP